MKIALVIPKNNSTNEKSFYDYKFYSDFLFSRKYFSYLLAIPTLASLTPPEHEVRVFDENIEDIDYGWDADLVGISVRTMFAKRAYAISEKFRAKGVKTVLGGIHPSMCTDESLEYCDSVVIGEAEKIWGRLLLDAEKGALKRTYKADSPTDLKTCSMPKRSSLTREKYFSDIVQTTKGCPFTCEFCSVYSYDGQQIRNKTVDQIIEEILDIQGGATQYKKKSIFFADDNIIANKKFALELFKALKPHNLNWSCQASINIAKDEEILKSMKASGCGAILVGLESISEKNLDLMDKGVNMRHDYLESIKTIQSHGILVHASFIFGYDFDTAESFDDLIAFTDEANLLMPLINILTPFPGTKLFERFEKEGRILHKDWDRYDGKSVVFKPTLMTPEELEAGFKKVIKHIYSFDSIVRKLTNYWQVDFWKHSNKVDPVALKYRLLFSFRLLTLLASPNLPLTKFVFKMLPKILFNKRVRVSTILTLMAYNDYAYSEPAKETNG